MHWCLNGKSLSWNWNQSVAIIVWIHNWLYCLPLQSLQSTQMSLAICEREKMHEEHCEEACRGALTPQITFHNIGPGSRLDCKHSVLSRPQNGGWGLEKALGERQLTRNNSWGSNSPSHRTFSISTHVHVLSPSRRCHRFLNLILHAGSVS